MTDHMKHERLRDKVADPYDGRPQIMNTSKSGAGWVAALIVLLLLVFAAWYFSSSGQVSNTAPLNSPAETLESAPASPQPVDPAMEPAPAPVNPLVAPPAANP